LRAEPFFKTRVRRVESEENAMTFSRRRFLHLAGSAAAFSAISCVAWARTYPTRPVRLIIGFAAGGAGDALARLTGQWLSDRLGQPFVIENRPGAGTNIGTEVVVKAPPDGHTLLFVTPANAINATLYPELSFDFSRDIAPVAGLIRVPNVMVVHPSVPVTTVPELIAYAKANPGKLNFAAGGIGTSGHLAGELLKMMAGINMVLVPYRGAAPAITDLLAGQVQMYMGPLSTTIENVKAGKLRAVAVTTATRSDALPDIPTMAEFLPNYEASTFQGIGAPRNTPVGIVDKLNKEINAAFADPKMKARLADFGTLLPGSPADFGKLITDETEKWAKVVKFAGIRPD
jgi:tripartite-type tricarboxylate transporter receptor subunit TctC